MRQDKVEFSESSYMRNIWLELTGEQQQKAKESSPEPKDIQNECEVWLREQSKNVYAAGN